MLFLFIASCQKQDVLKDLKIVLADDWQLISSVEINEMPQKISQSGIKLHAPYKTNVPSTVLAALVKNGVYADPYFGKNLEKIPIEQFDNSWWYIKKFNLKKGQNNENAILKFDGINYRATEGKSQLQTHWPAHSGALNLM
jgi:exo-1,4-beta-D-glucosaminidase